MSFLNIIGPLYLVYFTSCSEGSRINICHEGYMHLSDNQKEWKDLSQGRHQQFKRIQENETSGLQATLRGTSPGIG